MGDCNNCLQSVLLREMKERVTRLEEKSNISDVRLSELEKTTAVTSERTETLFGMIKEIKDSIQIIANKINSLEMKPGSRWEEVIKSVITLSVGAGIAFIIKK